MSKPKPKTFIHYPQNEKDCPKDFLYDIFDSRDSGNVARFSYTLGVDKYGKPYGEYKFIFYAELNPKVSYFLNDAEGNFCDTEQYEKLANDLMNLALCIWGKKAPQTKTTNLTRRYFCHVFFDDRSNGNNYEELQSKEQQLPFVREFYKKAETIPKPSVRHEPNRQTRIDILFKWHTIQVISLALRIVGNCTYFIHSEITFDHSRDLQHGSKIVHASRSLLRSLKLGADVEGRKQQALPLPPGVVAGGGGKRAVPQPQVVQDHVADNYVRTLGNIQEIESQKLTIQGTLASCKANLATTKATVKELTQNLAREKVNQTEFETCVHTNQEKLRLADAEEHGIFTTFENSIVNLPKESQRKQLKDIKNHMNMFDHR